MMIMIYSILFMISLYALYRLDHTKRFKTKLILASLFIFVNAFILVN